MKFFLTTIIFTLCALFSFSTAAPISAELLKRDVFDPPVISPGKGTVWKVDTEQTVTWNVTNPPKQITNNKGEIILSNNGVLDFAHPLATGFDIMLGKITVRVPNVPSGHKYQVIVFGDSGNNGPYFTITQ
ncbi:hypothetical protein K443DRAFT_676234 [Laccaria amethystina LaAM-08-1]|uniref:Uncharacterized protein n=1 Tax=Laccaria amethystina LaAM-08-1 TaxID=1095629 RepID=A0A0C9Y229_9AGAR|nr:hypothetical protein K443DRAFT_676234 [Laccaria amethystina LaAM-08-1]